MEQEVQERESTLAPLRYETFRNLWFASMASNFGGLIQGVGAAWLMTSIAESPHMVALVQTSNTLPIMLFALLGGAVADGFDRGRVMLISQVFMFVVSAALAVAAGLDLLTPWSLLAFTFLIGSAGAFNNPAWQAAVGDMVPRQHIGAAVLLNSASFNVTRSIGPAAGGAIVAAGGPFAAFALNTFSYLGMIAVLRRWRAVAAAGSLPREPLPAAIMAGLRYVMMSPSILKVLLRGFTFGFATIVILALLPLVTRDHLGGGALVYGGLLGAFGVGAVLGAFTSRRAREQLSNETLVRLALLAFFLCAVIAAESETVVLTGLGLVLGGAAWVMALSLFNTSVQMSTPRWVVGRALSLYQMALFGGLAIGSWVWGAIAEAYGVSAALLVAAISMILAGALGVRFPLPGSEAQNLDPLSRWREPEIALDVQPRSGPISIAVEYQIAEADIPDFLAVMRERQRIRRRDGAHHWRLMRDAGSPVLWFEQFELPTWMDYVRLHMRTTQADAPVVDRILQLHSGAEPPRVRRLLIRTTERGARQATPQMPHELQ